MKMMLIVLIACPALMGCVSSSNTEGKLPNYVTSQATQSPGIRNDNFGGAALSMRGLPR